MAGKLLDLLFQSDWPWQVEKLWWFCQIVDDPGDPESHPPDAFWEISMDRRTWVKGAIAGALAGNLQYSGPSAAANQVPPIEMIDCHTHFYDPSRAEGVPWPDRNSALYRTVLPVHLKALKQFRPVTGTVVVEASSWIQDNDWLLNLAKEDSFIVGIVGNVNPEKEDFAVHLKRLTGNPLFRGIRISVQQLSKLLASNSLDNLKLLDQHDLSLDVNGGPETPEVIASLASRVSSLRIVLNHIGNVQITDAPPPQNWKQGIAAAAKFPNVYCKVSALVEGASRGDSRAPKDPEFYRPFVDVVWNAFEDDRVIYGSNWPVSERAADYETLQRISVLYAEERGADALDRFCSKNAAAAYKWRRQSVL